MSRSLRVVSTGWLVRRLSPHCSRIELATLQAPGKELRLLHGMGWETANIHLGARTKRKQILSHLNKQRPKWLHEAADDMVTAGISDWKTWKKDGYI